jgi:hypothetical protein
MPRTRIAEPATSLTDLVLSGQTFWYAHRLRTGPASGDRSAAFWTLALAAAGISALAGAVTHAIHEDTSSSPLRALRVGSWKIVGLSTAAASACMLAAGNVGGLSAGRRRLVLMATASKAVLFAAASWRTGNFLFTILDYAASMLILLAIQLRRWRSSAAAPWLTGGILVSFIAAGIQRSKYALHSRFNHNDLYHVVQMAAFHLLYEGARRETDDDHARQDGTTAG